MKRKYYFSYKTAVFTKKRILKNIILTKYLHLVIPQISPFDFGDEAVNFGDSTSLTCSVHKGDLPIQFSWLHNNISVGYRNGVGVSKVGNKNSVLTIESITDQHSGIYTCLVKNNAGVTSYSAILNVNGKLIMCVFLVNLQNTLKLYQRLFLLFMLLSSSN